MPAQNLSFNGIVGQPFTANLSGLSSPGEWSKIGQDGLTGVSAAPIGTPYGTERPLQIISKNRAVLYYNNNVYVYQRTPTSTWVQMGGAIAAASLTPRPNSPPVKPTFQINSNGDTVAIAALSFGSLSYPWNGGNVPTPGGIRLTLKVYRFINGIWSQLGSNEPYLEGGYNYFNGYYLEHSLVSLSATGDTVAFAHPWVPTDNSYDSVQYPKGICKVFNFNGTEWIQKGQSIVNGVAGTFGVERTGDCGVLLNQEGTRVYVSNHRPNNPYGRYGEMYEFDGTSWLRLPEDIIITELIASGTTALCTTASPHGFLDGETVTIGGAVVNQGGANTPAFQGSQTYDNPYNGSYPVTVTGPNTFTYEMPYNIGWEVNVVSVVETTSVMGQGRYLLTLDSPHTFTSTSGPSIGQTRTFAQSIPVYISGSNISGYNGIHRLWAYYVYDPLSPDRLDTLVLAIPGGFLPPTNVPLTIFSAPAQGYMAFGQYQTNLPMYCHRGIPLNTDAVYAKSKKPSINASGDCFAHHFAPSAALQDDELEIHVKIWDGRGWRYKGHPISIPPPLAYQTPSYRGGSYRKAEPAIALNSTGDAVAYAELAPSLTTHNDDWDPSYYPDYYYLSGGMYKFPVPGGNWSTVAWEKIGGNLPEDKILSYMPTIYLSDGNLISVNTPFTNETGAFVCGLREYGGYTWQTSNGIPQWATLNESTGVISGTPDNATESTMYVTRTSPTGEESSYLVSILTFMKYVVYSAGRRVKKVMYGTSLVKDVLSRSTIFWTFTPSQGTTITGFRAVFTGAVNLLRDLLQTALTSNTLSNPNVPSTVRGLSLSSPSSVTSIICGTSSPKLGGTIDVSSFPNLTSITCSGNGITKFQGYGSLTNLVDINLSNNELNQVGFEALSNKPNLRTLNFAGTVSNQYIKWTGAFPDLSGITTLATIGINNSSLTGSNLNFSALTNLVTLGIQANLLSGNFPILPTGANSKLILINLAQNKTTRFTGAPPLLTDHPSCTSLAYSTNDATGPIQPLSVRPTLTSFFCNSNLHTGDIPSLSANTALTVFRCESQRGTTKITGFAGGTVSATLGDFSANDNQLTAAAVNAILAAFVAAGRVKTPTNTCTLNLGGTGNAAPTGQGITDKATLQGRGWTVTTN